MSLGDYVGYPGKYWELSQCPWLDIITVSSLGACMAACEQHNDCTAIVYDHDDTSRNCRLLKCPAPVPQPSGTNADWTGYAKRIGR